VHGVFSPENCIVRCIRRGGQGIVERVDFTYSGCMLLQNARYINEYNRLAFGDIRIKPLIETSGFSNIVHNVLFHSRPDMIRHLMVGGSWIMRERKVLTIDEREVETSYARVCRELFIPQRSESSGIITGSITERVPGT
jgi:hypothetical protein